MFYDYKGKKTHGRSAFCLLFISWELHSGGANCDEISLNSPSFVVCLHLDEAPQSQEREEGLQLMLKSH